jgi:hypothetical protein
MFKAAGVEEAMRIRLKGARLVDEALFILSTFLCSAPEDCRGLKEVLRPTMAPPIPSSKLKR